MDDGKEIEQINWRGDGLVPVIVQGSKGKVLTLAYMNDEALQKTLERGYACYYSRSKDRIRMKGEVSGNVQKVKKIRVDCDEDVLLLKVDQEGPACHTGENSCFYKKLGEDVEEPDGIDYSLEVIKELEELIRQRQRNPERGSYTCELLERGGEKIREKVGEEAVEIVLAKERENLIYEVADFIYHLLVLLQYENVEINEVMEELEKRRN